ncbi:hypothetical protein [Thiocapsa sp.]|nr:hypothetical protein [Thiocapsa sp.]
MRPLHVLLGHRHPDKAAFCEAIQAASDLQLTDLDDAFGISPTPAAPAS